MGFAAKPVSQHYTLLLRQLRTGFITGQGNVKDKILKALWAHAFILISILVVSLLACTIEPLIDKSSFQPSSIGIFYYK